MSSSWNSFLPILYYLLVLLLCWPFLLIPSCWRPHIFPASDIGMGKVSVLCLPFSVCVHSQVMPFSTRALCSLYTPTTVKVTLSAQLSLLTSEIYKGLDFFIFNCLLDVFTLMSQRNLKINGPELHSKFYFTHIHTHTHTCLLLSQASPEENYYLHFSSVPDENLGVIFEFTLSLLLHLYSVSNSLALPPKSI